VEGELKLIASDFLRFVSRGFKSGQNIFLDLALQLIPGMLKQRLLCSLDGKRNLIRMAELITITRRLEIPLGFAPTVVRSSAQPGAVGIACTIVAVGGFAFFPSVTSVLQGFDGGSMKSIVRK
jgi:hypothetical protein